MKFPSKISANKMRAVLVILLSVMNVQAYSQPVDSEVTPGPSSSSPKSSNGRQTRADPITSQTWRIISRGNVSFKAYNIPISVVENTILNLESLECDALKSRDTTALIELWARDFTIDKRQNQLVTSKNPLPNYLSLVRMIEMVTTLDGSTVITSGYELFQEIKAFEKIEEPATRKFLHTWSRKSGQWRLVTKTKTTG